MSHGLIATTGVSSFGTVAVAMVTPFTADGQLDIPAARKLAARLVEQGCDALILSGTTGESPTTSDAEKITLIKEVRAELGDDVVLCAGAGSYDTHHSVELARKCAAAGADSLLVVTPYYSKPPQEGVYQHFVQVASATDLPVCLYDIPGRTATPLAADTITRLAELPTVQAVKDAKGDLALASTLIQETGLAWYSGDDPLNLAWLAVGASGFISVIGHVAAGQLRALYDSFNAGELDQARHIQHQLMPLTQAQAMLGGVSFAKAALKELGCDVGVPRLPQIPPTSEQAARLHDYLHKAGVFS